MDHPKVLLYDQREAPLTGLLREVARQESWRFQRARDLDAWVRELRGDERAVAVVRVGRDLYRELAFLETVRWFVPEAPVIVVTDSDDATLCGLIWDLGACHLVAPPWSAAEVAEVVQGFLRPPAAPQTPLVPDHG